VSTVLWCTGPVPETGWIAVEGALDEHGRPVHDRGASPVAGLHWMGLPWQTRLNSSIIDGVDRDARRTVERILLAEAG
jgi:putative flavoprotein involved in K+ transport